MTVSELRRALLGVPPDALVVIQDDVGNWSPSYAEHLPIGLANGHFVLSDAGAGVEESELITDQAEIARVFRRGAP